MKAYTIKEKLQNVLSVGAGGIMGFAILSLLNLFLLLFFLPGGRDSESPENSSLFKVLAITTVVISCLVAGFVTAKISTRKTFIHVLLTGIVLFLILLAISDFKWEDFSTTDWVGLLATIPCTLLGGLRETRKQSASNLSI